MKQSKQAKYSLILYLISMALPVYLNEWGFYGFQAFLLSWVGVFEMEAYIVLPCIANLTYITGLMLKGRVLKTRIALSIITIFFSLFAFGVSLPIGKGGLMSTSFLGFGFLFWMMSFVLLFVAQVREMRDIEQNSEASLLYKKVSKNDLIGYFVFLLLGILIAFVISNEFHSAFDNWD